MVPFFKSGPSSSLKAVPGLPTDVSLKPPLSQHPLLFLLISPPLTLGYLGLPLALPFTHTHPWVPMFYPLWGLPKFHPNQDFSLNSIFLCLTSSFSWCPAGSSNLLCLKITSSSSFHIGLCSSPPHITELNFKVSWGRKIRSQQNLGNSTFSRCMKPSTPSFLHHR